MQGLASAAYSFGPGCGSNPAAFRCFLAGSLVELLSLTLLNAEGSLWADGKTCTEAVAEAVAHNPGLAAVQFNGTLGAVCDALAAAVAEGLVKRRRRTRMQATWNKIPV